MAMIRGSAPRNAPRHASMGNSVADGASEIAGENVYEFSRVVKKVN